MRLSHRIFLWAVLLTATACSSIDKYNPFGEDKPPESYKPANATEYLCANNQRFFVRTLEQGKAVWLIYPEREVRLERLGEDGKRYGNGVATLEIDADGATLNDGPSISYSDCKPPQSAAK